MPLRAMSGYPPGMARLLFILLLFAAMAAPAQAWSPLGHRLIGELAQRQLDPAAQREVARLLAGEPEPTLAGVANWADTLRQSDPARFRATSRWHYINVRSGPACTYQRERDCADGDCVIEALERERAVLADRRQSLARRRDALKFVVHFAGDIHQPMHNGVRDDAGGNQVELELHTTLEPEAYAREHYVDGVMATNLHALWDYYVLGELRLDEALYLRLLMAAGPVPPGTPLATPAAWSRESCLLNEAWGTYPLQATLDRRFADAMRPLAERRILQGGYRLAALLNEALGEQRR